MIKYVYYVVNCLTLLSKKKTILIALSYPDIAIYTHSF